MFKAGNCLTDNQIQIQNTVPWPLLNQIYKYLVHVVNRMNKGIEDGNHFAEHFEKQKKQKMTSTVC